MSHKSYFLYQKKCLFIKYLKNLQKSIKFKSLIFSSFHDVLDLLILIMNTYITKNIYAYYESQQ